METVVGSCDVGLLSIARIVVSDSHELNQCSTVSLQSSRHINTRRHADIYTRFVVTSLSSGRVDLFLKLTDPINLLAQGTS